MNFLVNIKIFQAFFQITLNIYANLVCLKVFNNLFSDVTILEVLA